jgi:thioredoxin-dependent peroxiredoxin
MTIQLGQIALDFEQHSSCAPIKLHIWEAPRASSSAIPKDLTPVCTTELIAVAHLTLEWGRWNVRPLGLSVNSIENHAGWEEEVPETQEQAVNFPVIAHKDRAVRSQYGMVHLASDPSLTVRSVFIIDDNKKVQLILTYPPPMGRRFEIQLQ